MFVKGGDGYLIALPCILIESFCSRLFELSTRLGRKLGDLMLEYMEADRVGDCAIDVSYFIGIIS